MSTIKVNAIQHSGGANVAMTLSSNGSVVFPNTAIFSSRVGIGNTSPTSPLHVEGPTDDGLPIVRFNANTTTATPFQWISSCLASGMGTGQNFVHLFGKAQSTPNSGYIGYKHQADNSNLNSVTIGMFGSNNLLNVYGGGQVTMPSQPSFLVAKDDGGSALAGGQTVLWNSVNHNIGNCYSAATGRFTAPIAGRYFFSCFMIGSAGGTNTGQSFYFGFNGSSSGYHPYTRSTGADFVGWSGSCIINLNSGDYVTIYLSEGPIYATGARHNGFCGYLLG